MLIPVFTITILSLLYNVHFFIRRKREDRCMLSEEEIMQLRAAREPVAFEERSEETVEVKQKKRLFGRLRKRCKGKNENNHRIDENETNHQETVCNSSTRSRHKEESIELKEIQGIPSVADSKTTKKNDDTVHAPTDEDRRPTVSEPPRTGKFLPNHRRRKWLNGACPFKRNPETSQSGHVQDTKFRQSQRRKKRRFCIWVFKHISVASGCGASKECRFLHNDWRRNWRHGTCSSGYTLQFYSSGTPEDCKFFRSLWRNWWRK